MQQKSRALTLHEQLKGKLEIVPKIQVKDRDSLALVYTPGVGDACMEISRDVMQSYNLTGRGNTIAIITDGTAVLGLGDIGAEAGMPVMEGKALLFKQLADVNTVPLCVRSKDVDELVRVIYLLSGSFGAINLEDISAPRCFEVERRLKQICDIPVFHDDQHGTAIVVGAALTNALKLAKKSIREAKIVISGAGAAGIGIAEFLLMLGAQNLVLCDRQGVLVKDAPSLNAAQQAIALKTNPENIKGSLRDAAKGADVLIGVSAAGVFDGEMVGSMNDKAVVFAMANPVPEIMPDLAYKAGAFIVGTGRSDFENQINNVLAFPSIFKGALDVCASQINDQMKLAAAQAIASGVADSQLSTTKILPDLFDKDIHKSVAHAVSEAAIMSGVSRKV